MDAQTHSIADGSEDSTIADGSEDSTLQPPPAKKPKRKCHFDSKWIEEFQAIGRSSKGNYL